MGTSFLQSKISERLESVCGVDIRLLESNNRKLAEESKRKLNSSDHIIAKTVLVCNSMTSKGLEREYRIFLENIVFLAKSAFQREIVQLIYPIYINIIGLHVKDNHSIDNIRSFISNFRGFQPSSELVFIEEVYNNPGIVGGMTFNYKVFMTKFAYDYLIYAFEKHACPVVQSIFSINIDVAITDSTKHEYLFQDQTEINISTGEKKQILEDVDYKLPFLSATYTVDSSSYTFNNDDSYGYQSLPDVAHVDIYNHCDSINHIAVSQNTRLLAVASGPAVFIHSLDGMTYFGKEKTPAARLVSHIGSVYRVAISKCSKLLVSGSSSGPIKVSHLEAFIPLYKFEAQSHPVSCLDWSHNSCWIAAGYMGQYYSVTDIRDGKILRLYASSGQPITCMFDKNDTFLITSSYDNFVNIYDLRSGSSLPYAKFHVSGTPTVTTLDWRNQHIAVGLEDGCIELWELSGSRRSWKRKNSETAITDIAFTKDASPLILATSFDKELVAYKMDDGGSEHVMKIENYSSSLDVVHITERNSVLTVGRSLRGNVTL